MGATATLETISVDGLAIQPSGAYRLLRVAGLGSPTPRGNVFQRAERHGSVDHTAYYDARVVEVSGLVLADTDAELWPAYDALKAKLALGADRVLVFRRRGLTYDERMLVRVASPVDDEYVVGQPFVKWSVQVLAADPRIYGATLRSASYDPSAALGGGGLNLDGGGMNFPMQFSVTTASTLAVANDGNFPSPPVFTIRGPVINPTVDNVTTGESLRVLYSLGASDTVEVDVAARTVKLNGALRADLFDASTSVWWEVAPGANALRLRGSGMALGATLLSATWRDARI